MVFCGVLGASGAWVLVAITTAAVGASPDETGEDVGAVGRVLVGRAEEVVDVGEAGAAGEGVTTTVVSSEVEPD